MFEDMENTIKDWTDEDEVADYLSKLLKNKLSMMPDLFMVWGMRFILFNHTS